MIVQAIRGFESHPLRHSSFRSSFQNQQGCPSSSVSTVSLDTNSISGYLRRPSPRRPRTSLPPRPRHVEGSDLKRAGSPDLKEIQIRSKSDLLDDYLHVINVLVINLTSHQTYRCSREAHISAQQPPPQEETRFQEPHAHPPRSRAYLPPPPQRAEAGFRLIWAEADLHLR